MTVAGEMMLLDVRTDALVVGGSIHTRLQRRAELRKQGYHVTLVNSPHQGLTQLGRHTFGLCALDLTDVPGAREWRRRYEWTSEIRGTVLLESVAG